MAFNFRKLFSKWNGVKITYETTQVYWYIYIPYNNGNCMKGTIPTHMSEFYHNWSRFICSFVISTHAYKLLRSNTSFSWYCTSITLLLRVIFTLFFFLRCSTIMNILELRCSTSEKFLKTKVVLDMMTLRHIKVGFNCDVHKYCRKPKASRLIF